MIKYPNFPIFPKKVKMVGCVPEQFARHVYIEPTYDALSDYVGGKIKVLTLSKREGTVLIIRKGISWRRRELFNRCDMLGLRALYGPFLVAKQVKRGIYTDLPSHLEDKYKARYFTPEMMLPDFDDPDGGKVVATTFARSVDQYDKYRYPIMVKKGEIKNVEELS